MEDDSEKIYQFRIKFIGVSPMIYRRVLVSSETSLANLHHIFQSLFGWTDEYLHWFLIYGKRIGTNKIGACNYFEDSYEIPLSSYKFQEKDKFLYSYNFFANWDFEIRLEKITKVNKKKDYPICISGSRGAPPEDCNNYAHFLSLKLENHQATTMFKFSELILKCFKDESLYSKYEDELRELAYWATINDFQKELSNKRLEKYRLDNNCFMNGVGYEN